MTDTSKGYTPLPKTGVIPEVKYNKNGFEIRSDVLQIAADFVKWEFQAKVSAGYPPKELHVPTIEDVMNAAATYNSFINNCVKTSVKTFLQEDKDD